MAPGDLDIVRQFFAALRGEDPELVRETIERCFDPDAEWHTMRELPGGGVRRGRDAVAKELEDQRSAFGDIEAEVEDLRAVGDQAVARLVLRNRPHGGSVAFESRVGNIYTFKEGKIFRVRAFRDHAEAIAVAEKEAGFRLAAKAGSSEGPVFYFDLGSPYSYLAAERINQVLREPPVWQPVLLGGLFRHFDRRSWSETEERADGIAEVERRARERGLPPVKWPDPWPGNTLFAMRVATFAAGIGRAAPFALAAFRQAFVAGRDLTVPDNVLIAAAACELHPKAVLAAAESAGTKEALRTATEQAAQMGVRGVPSVLVGEEVFWGDDRLEDAAEALRALQP